MAGKTQLIRSKDAGRTWSEPVTITDTPLDDRDAGIITLKDGTLIVSWFISYFHPDDPRWAYNSEKECWRPYVEKITEQDKEKWLGRRLSDNSYQWSSGHWIRRSTDNGYTWEDPVRVSATAPHGPIELADGSLLYVGNGEKCIVAEKSYDKGKTWRVESTIHEEAGDGGYLCEPHAVEVTDDRIIAHFRYEIRNDRSKQFLWQAESNDGGRSWSKPYETAIWGYPPHLIRLKDSRILVVYGYRREPFGERACFSHDGGRTWDIENEVVLCYSDNGDLGYPASVELDDSTIITVYYEKDDPAEKTCLKAVYWKPD
jgi:sialidase-1